MLFKSTAVAAALAASSFSCWTVQDASGFSSSSSSLSAKTAILRSSSSSSSSRSSTALGGGGIPADVPMWSDDVNGRRRLGTTSTTRTGSTSNSYNNGPNPLNVKHKDAMIRQVYEEWRTLYGREDIADGEDASAAASASADKVDDRFAIFKLNYLTSQRAHALQTSRAKMDGQPLPAPLEMNAYADCTNEEYQELMKLEAQKLIAPRTKVQQTAPAAAAAADVPAVAKEDVTAQPEQSRSTMTSTSPSVSYSLRPDVRGMQEGSATNFPQRTAAHSKAPPTVTSPPPAAAAAATTITTSKKEEEEAPIPFPELDTKSLQEKLNDLKKAAEDLAASRKASSSTSSTSSTSSIDPSTSSTTGVKKPLPSKNPSATTSLDPSAAVAEKKTVPPPPPPNMKKPSQFMGVGTASQKPLAPKPSSSHYVRPDNIGSFGDPSAKYFPKRAATTVSSSPPKPVPADVRGPDDKQSATTFPKRTEAHEKGTIGASPTASTDASSEKDSSTSRLRPDVYSLGQSATDFPKRPVNPPAAPAPAPPAVRPQAVAPPPDKKKAVSPGSSSSSSSSYIRPDIFYKDQSQSATNFPKRKPSYDAPVALVQAAQFRDDVAPATAAAAASKSTTTTSSSANTTSRAGATAKTSSTRTSASTLIPDQQKSATAAPFSFKRRANQNKNAATTDLPPPEYKRSPPPSTPIVEEKEDEQNTVAVDISDAVASTSAAQEQLVTESSSSKAAPTITTADEEEAPKERAIPTLQDILKAEREADKKEKVDPKEATTAAAVKEEKTVAAPPAEPTLEAVSKAVKYRADAEARMKQWKQTQAEQPQPKKKAAAAAVPTESSEVLGEQPTGNNEKDDLAEQSLLELRSVLQARLEAVQEEARFKAQEETARALIAKEVFQRSLLEKQLQMNKKAAQAAAAASVKEEVSVPKTSQPTPTQAEAPQNASPPVDKAARQKEIEEALKADFNQAAVAAAAVESPPPMDPGRQKQIEAIMEGNAPEEVVDPKLARQKEIKDALKADFNAAAYKTTFGPGRQQQIEAVFEGKVQVKKSRREEPVYDPFAVTPAPATTTRSRSSASMPSVQDVLKAEMEAARSLRGAESSTSKPAASSAATTATSSIAPSIQDILKAEREAAEKMKESSAQVDATLSSSSSSSPESSKEMSNRERKLQNWKSNGKKKKKGKNNNKNTN